MAAQLLLFPGARRVLQAHAGERRVFVAAVDDELASELPTVPVPMDDQISVRYVRGAEVVGGRLTADFWIDRPEASAFDRRVILITLADDVLEQDSIGRLWLNGAQLEGGVLVDAAQPVGASSTFSAGAAAALLCMHRELRRCAIVVNVIGPVLWVFEQPRALAPGPILEGWRVIARELWRDASAV